MALRKFRWRQRGDRFEAVQPWSIRAAKFFDGLRFTANGMTLFGLVLSVPAGICFVFGQFALGAAFMAVSLLSDFFDGAIGRYQEEVYHKVQGFSPMTVEEEARLSLWQRVNFRGITHLGRSLDPLADKARTIVFLLTVGYNRIDPWLIWSIILVAIALTIIRPIKQWMKLDHAGSNRFGKFKIWAEVTGMVTWLLLYAWTEVAIYATVMNLCFLFALVLGLVSLLGHIRTGLSAYRKRERAVRATRLIREISRS